MPTPVLKESRVDCLIIGAGPSGLFCAHGLAQAGLNIRVVDKRPERVSNGHADGIQPRTIEVLRSYGLEERLLKQANQMHMAAFYNPGSAGGIELTERCPAVNAPARYPFKATLHQGAIEEIFVDSLESMGVFVDRPAEPLSLHTSDERELLDPTSHPIQVVLKRLDTEETELVRARYVVGADGAHSWVRKTLGIALDGEQTNYTWGVVDCVPDTDFPDIRNWCGIHSHNGSCMVIPREGKKVRLYIQLDERQAAGFESEGRLDKSKTTVDRIMEVARATFHPYTIGVKGDVEWWTIYRIGQRVASSYSSFVERVLIVGDACHTHSPKAGQGMNAGMLDSHNLVWKLAHVIRGTAHPGLLRTYETERRAYAQDLIDFDKKFAGMFSGKPWSKTNQNGVSHKDFSHIYLTFSGFTSGVGVQYAESSIVDARHQYCAPKLIVGQRMPSYVFMRAADSRPVDIQDVLPADTRFKFVVFAGNTSDRSQLRLLHKLSDSLSFLSSSSSRRIFDLVLISAVRKGELSRTQLPPLLASQWPEKILVDDLDASRRLGGHGYNEFGIDRQGVVVVVRPDGYVGMVAPYDKVIELEAYIKRILV
ncbi:FAD binding domain-containing protein [Schizophyllum amplum]|uniref:FAD binding domain-containing protein n=1 Tax=Schizophyllum amplum TaxID=97359 RepID=A0A550CTC0_9AGAR|nr:FAD binding domain-containing protein [Auriculariopsis ampla]